MKRKTIKGTQNRNLFRPVGDDGVERPVIWVRYFNAARGRLEESLKTESLAEARQLRDQRIADFMGLKARKASKVHLVSEKFPEFLELKKIKAKATYSSYRLHWEKHLEPYFGKFILDEITETEWLTYVQEKRKTAPKRKFFNDQKCLSGFMHWLHRGGLIAKLPKLANVDPETAEGLVYSDEQIKAILEKSHHDLNLQLKMALTMGMRIGEINSLEWDQVDFKKKIIWLPAHKTKIRKERRFGISEICLEPLRARKSESKGTAVFPSPMDPNQTLGRDGHKKQWANCKTASGIPKAHRFHWLRHTFLTHAFKKSVNPALICEYAGLSLEEASKTYLHFTPEDTRIVASLMEIPL